VNSLRCAFIFLLLVVPFVGLSQGINQHSRSVDSLREFSVALLQHWTGPILGEYVDRNAKGIATLNEQEKAEMTGTSWRPGCPVPFKDLRRIHLIHWNSDGLIETGVVIVHKLLAADVYDAFRLMFMKRFVIHSVKPIRVFNGDDLASVRANNTSAFNCRPMTGGRRWSRHALGRAIDINPKWNPYQKRKIVIPDSGRAFLSRAKPHRGKIVADDWLVVFFKKRGWRWGGNWRSLKDYQHFEKR
jgi:hypothetical protein